MLGFRQRSSTTCGRNGQVKSFNDARDDCREDVEDEVVRRPKDELIDIVMAII